MSNAGDVVVNIVADSSGLDAGLNNAARQLGGMNGRLASASSALATMGTTATVAAGALGAGIGLSVKTAMDFEAQMSKVKALSGATGQEFDSLRQSAIDLGASSVFSASEAAAGMQNLAAAGLKTDQVLAAMPGVLNAAAASGEDFASVSDIMITAMNGFGLAAGDMGHIADVLASAANASSISVSQIGLSLKYVGPIAASSGQSLEMMSAALAILGNAGIKADSAGTALRMSLARLSDPPKEAAAQIASLGLKITDAQGKILPLSNVIGQLHEKFKGLNQSQRNAAASTLFGTEAMSAMLTLINKGPAEMDKLTTAFKNSQGVAKETAEVMNNNLKGALSTLSGSIETAQIGFGTALIPAIRATATVITTLVNAFNSLPDSAKSFIAIGTAVTAALLGIAGAVALAAAAWPAFIAGAGAISGLFAGISTPALAVVGAVVGVGAAFAKLMQENEEFRRSVTGAWSEISQAAREVWPYISEYAKAAWETIKDLWTIGAPMLAGIIGPAFTAIAEIVKGVMGGIKGTIQIAFAVFAGIVKTGSALISGDWSGALSAMKEMGQGIWAGIKTSFSAGFNMILGVAKSAGTAILQSIAGLVQGIQNWMGAKLQAALAPARSAINAVKSAFYGLYDAVVGHSYVPDMVDGVERHMKRLPRAMVTPAQQAAEKAKKEFQKLQESIGDVLGDMDAHMSSNAAKWQIMGESFDRTTADLQAVESALHQLGERGLSATDTRVQILLGRWKDLKNELANKKAIEEATAALEKFNKEEAQRGSKKLHADIGRFADAKALEMVPDSAIQGAGLTDALNGLKKGQISEELMPVIKSLIPQAIGAVKSLANVWVDSFAKIGNITAEQADGIKKELGELADRASSAASDLLNSSDMVTLIAKAAIHYWSFAGNSFQKAWDGLNGVTPESKVVTTVLGDLSAQLDVAHKKAVAFGDSFDLVSANISAYEKAINSLIESGISPMSEEVQNLSQQLDGFKKAKDAVEGLNKLAETLTKTEPIVSNFVEALNNTSYQLRLIAAKKNAFPDFDADAAQLSTYTQEWESLTESLLQGKLRLDEIPAAMARLSILESLIGHFQGLKKSSEDAEKSVSKFVEALDNTGKQLALIAAKKNAFPDFDSEAAQLSTYMQEWEALTEALLQGKLGLDKIPGAVARLSVLQGLITHLQGLKKSAEEAEKASEALAKKMQALTSIAQAYGDAIRINSVGSGLFGTDQLAENLSAAESKLKSLIAIDPRDRAPEWGSMYEEALRQFNDFSKQVNDRTATQKIQTAISERNKRIIESAKQMASGLGSVLSSALGDTTFNFGKFAQSFESSLREAIIGAIVGVIQQKVILEKLQPLLKQFSTAIEAGNIEQAKGFIPSIFSKGREVAGSLNPIITELRNIFADQANIPFAVPALAAGGVVTGPTLALIGEKGPEAVVPLSSYGNGGGVVINIGSVGSKKDADELADKMVRKLRRAGVKI